MSKTQFFPINGLRYTSCEPCPMCLEAIYWARPKLVFYGCNKEDAKPINFDDRFIYDALEKELENRQIAFVQLLRKDALSVFKRWEEKNDKTKYWPKTESSNKR